MNVAASWVGTYEIARIVIRYHDSHADAEDLLRNRTVTFTPAGTRDARGINWGVKGQVNLVAGGPVSAEMEVLKNGLHYDFTDTGSGNWSREGTVLNVDYVGDQGYRRKFSVTVDGCTLKAVLISPPNFGLNTPGFSTKEFREVDLRRIR